MTKKLSSLFIMVVTLLIMSSCLGTSEDKTTYYDDTAITAFSLGTLNITRQTKTKDGLRDSTVKSTYKANSYHFNIDQVNRLIYNADSLPYGTDAAHVLATITSKNSGTIVFMLKNVSGKDSIVYYKAKDSINFTHPVKMRVYNMRASAYREYTVKVNIHQESGDEFKWGVTSVYDLELASQSKFINNNGTMYLFAGNVGSTVGYKYNGSQWQILTFNISLNTVAVANLITQNGVMYTLQNGNIISSTDGENWNNVASSASLNRLIGASPKSIYALTNNGISISKDHGITWTKDSLDDDVSKLPDTDINFICQPSQNNSSTYNIILIGNKNNKTVVWSKDEENSSNANAQPWAFYTEDEYNRLKLPFLSSLQVIAYDGGLLATGGNLSTFYYSPDNGLTWKADSSYPCPEGFSGNASAAMGCNNNHVIFLTKTGSAQIYTARRARLGWETSQKVFTK